MAQVSPLWYLRRAIQAVDENDWINCTIAMHGFQFALIASWDLARIMRRNGHECPDVEREERQELLQTLQAKIEERKRQARQ
ncbi:MAG: hypothetical protein J2P36_08280 [Ktedonobacteraceae bacterium]|nr:hypothetical protein [Ktedonobacteraceae bacterium]